MENFGVILNTIFCTDCLIDLCRTKRIEVVNIGLCLLNDKFKFSSLDVQGLTFAEESDHGT